MKKALFFDGATRISLPIPEIIKDKTLIIGKSIDSDISLLKPYLTFLFSDSKKFSTISRFHAQVGFDNKKWRYFLIPEGRNKTQWCPANSLEFHILKDETKHYLTNGDTFYFGRHGPLYFIELD